MTQGDLAAYWAAIAQVIPVVALAFVIEARLITRRMSKKRAFKHRASRVRWSFAFFVLATSLTASEFVALRGLTLPEDAEVTAVDGLFYLLSLFAVVVSLSVVVSLPVASMVAASTTDIARWARLRAPWGKFQQLRRITIAQIEQVNNLRRIARSQRIDVLVMSARVLLDDRVDVVNVQRALLRSLNEVDPDAVDPTGVLRAQADLDPNQDLWAYRVSRLLYEGLLAHDRKLRKLKKEFRKQLRDFDMLTRVDSPEFVRLQRASMAAAAKMP